MDSPEEGPPALSEPWDSPRPTILTIGHSHDPLDAFLERLKRHEIALVVDVRSRPWIRRAEHFNREALAPALEDRGFDYLWLGEHLGQRPEGDQFYDHEGHTLYDRVVLEDWFLKAIGQVEYEAERRQVVLMCLEEEPERCHRYHLLGRILTKRSASAVVHVRRDGRVETQAQVAQRLGEGQASLFAAAPEVWRSPEPMRGGHGAHTTQSNSSSSGGDRGPYPPNEDPDPAGDPSRRN
jgi:hypothetical protein